MNKLVMATLTLFLMTACQKDQNVNTASTERVAMDPNEISLEQETAELKNEKGETVRVTYFAKGENIAVKLEMNGKTEELIAKKINTKGEPVFANERYMWEGAVGLGGKLTDAEGNESHYKESED